MLIRASLCGYKRKQQRQSLSVSLLSGEHKHHDDVSWDILGQNLTILGMDEYMFSACNFSQSSSATADISQHHHPAIALRLPVFDKMSAAAFDALMSKTMEHFLGPLLSTGYG